MTNRLAPLSEPYAEPVAAMLAGYPRIDGYLLNLFRTFANSERFLARCVPNLLDTDSPLPLKVREIVILRVTALARCEYEWGVHVSVFSGAAGLTDAQICDTTADEPQQALWDADALTLLQTIDALCRTGHLEPSLSSAFEARWTAAQQLEILALIGTYRTISLVANVANLPCEDFAARFPVA